eukprot:Rhum_TRINITY_DN15447_c1_g6::Rhum_TRINITY_DN15447_c1_g6_i1::g.157809::m.157809
MCSKPCTKKPVASPRGIVATVASRLEAAVRGTEWRRVALPEATVFDARKEPGFSIGEYFSRLMYAFGCSAACGVVALLYVQRTGLRCTRMNVHRLVLGCLIVAVKHQDDKFYSDSVYAHLSGVQAGEIARLCTEVVTLTDFELFVTQAEYRRTLRGSIAADVVESTPAVDSPVAVQPSVQARAQAPAASTAATTTTPVEYENAEDASEEDKSPSCVSARSQAEMADTLSCTPSLVPSPSTPRSIA